jgi:hypothetical protein
MMAKVICTHPNCSEMNSGVRFSPRGKHMVSEEISDDQAAWFTSIPGYALLRAKKEDAPTFADSTDAGGQGDATGTDASTTPTPTGADGAAAQ